MKKDDPKNKKLTENQTLAQLERQVERGSLFTHTIVSRNAEEIHEAESVLYGVVDLLIEKGIVTRDEILQNSGRIRQEMEEKGQTIGPGIALQIEGKENGRPEFVPVNCSERIHICKAICCKLHFALTAEEVELGQLKWDLGAPYFIRQESTGYCHNLDSNTKGCSVYHHRPGICRRYSCAHDERIWKDFERMELNEEWIRENLGGSQPRLAEASMTRQDRLTSRTSEESSQ